VALELTQAAQIASSKTTIGPQLVLRIEGLDTVFGAAPILKYIRVGDDGLTVGGDAPGILPATPWVIGGFSLVDDSENLISLDGSGTSISQQLYQDKGSVSSIPSLKMKLLDKNQLLSQLISPGVELTDMLGRRAQVFFGFQGTGYPEDFVEIFRGIIDDIESGAGDVTLNIAHPDTKKRQELFTKKTMVLTGAMDDTQDSIPITGAAAAGVFLERFDNPALGQEDTTFETYVRIDDEILRYNEVDATGMPSDVLRGQLGTVASAHDADAEVVPFYVIETDLVDAALKLMISGRNGSYVSGLSPTSFNVTDGTEYVANSIFFQARNLTKEDNLQVGDVITTTLSAEPDNNQLRLIVTQIVPKGDGCYVVVETNTALVDETTTTAAVALRSQYDSWPEGLAMDPRDVDIEGHHYWQDLVLSQFEYRFYIKEQINGKDFLEKEIYAPYGAYSIPRKGLASLGYHIGPVPTTALVQLNKNNVVNPQKIRLKRTLSRNFYNTIVYKYDLDSLEDKFLSGLVYTNEDSKTQIPVGTKAFVVSASGIRTDLDAVLETEIAAQRLLDRYKYAAEYFENVEVFFKAGFNLDPGDLVVFDFTDLKITNTQDGTREKPRRYFEVVNKAMDLKTGIVKLTLLDTTFATSDRYGIIGPSSVITSGGTTFAIIEESYGGVFPGAEYRKWENYVGLPVLVHNADYSFSEEATFIGFDSFNPFKMLFAPSSPLSAAPSAGYIVDLPDYPTDTDKETNSEYKLIHAHWGARKQVLSSAGTNFKFNISHLADNIRPFYVGAPVVVHSDDWTTVSPEAKILSLTLKGGPTRIEVEVDTDLGFVPQSLDYISFLGFPDEDPCYRFL
jgi:hypothetical protein